MSALHITVSSRVPTEYEAPNLSASLGLAEIAIATRTEQGCRAASTHFYA